MPIYVNVDSPNLGFFLDVPHTTYNWMTKTIMKMVVVMVKMVSMVLVLMKLARRDMNQASSPLPSAQVGSCW